MSGPDHDVRLAHRISDSRSNANLLDEPRRTGYAGALSRKSIVIRIEFIHSLDAHYFDLHLDSMRNFRNAQTLILPPLVLLICFLCTSFYGLNFGIQWDEPVTKLNSVRESLSTGLFLQSSGNSDQWTYSYGGVNYLLTWLGLTPELLHYFRSGPLTREALSASILPKLYTMAFRIRIRGVYLVFSSLAIPWLFYLGIVLGRSRLEAFLAAAILAGSWEFAYHSRYMAPDTVMLQFVLLAFLCLAVGCNRPKLRWFYAGAIAIGLAAGTKYPGALLLPLFLIGAAHAMWQQRRSVVDTAGHCTAVAGTAVLTFLMTTPGAILDPFRFFNQLQAQQHLYATGWFGYTVKPGFSHLMKILKYFMLQGFSHYWTLSTILMVFCLLGCVAIVLERKLFGLLILGFVSVHVGYFSQQAAMIVRHELAVLPFLCLTAARGVTWVATRRGPLATRLLYGCLGIILGVNVGWEIYAAYQIGRREDLNYFVNKFETYVRSDPANTYLITKTLLNALATNPAPVPGNIVTDPQAPHTKVAFFQSEGPDVYWANWPSNSWGLYEANFGALEVNLEAYTTFVGNQRIIVVRKDNLRKLPVLEQVLRSP